jgi:hypothetical protein
MKSPERSPFTEYPHRRAPGPLGQAHSAARTIEGIDVPYMKSLRPDGSIARKSGEFMTLDRKRVDEVKVTTYLWGDVVLDGGFLTASFGPQFGKAKAHAYGTVITDSTYTLPNSFYLYAGDGYLWRLACRDDYSGFWPVLVRETLGNEFAPNAANAGKSISFFSTALLEGGADIDQAARGISLVASGHDGSAYRVGFSGMYEYDPPTAVLASGGPSNGVTVGYNYKTETRAWFTNTGDFSINASWTFDAPLAERETGPARIQHAGPGRLLALQTYPEQVASLDYQAGPANYQGTLKTQLVPRILRSTNHGSTWSAIEATFLTPYIEAADAINQTGFPGDRWNYDLLVSYNRPGWNNSQLVTMARAARFIYCGSDTVLLIVPQCWLGGADFATLLFRSTDGGESFARIAWPPDDWTDIWPNVPSFEGMFFNACWSLGAGHAFVPVEGDDLKVRALYTQDYGTTWSLSSEVPDEYLLEFTKAFFVTPIRPGVGLVPKLDVIARRITWAQVGKNFASLLPIGSVAVGSAVQPPEEDSIGYAGRFFAYVGDTTGTYPRRINPAYPTEFNA